MKKEYSYLYKFYDKGTVRNYTMTEVQVAACANEKYYTPKCKRIAGEIMRNDFAAGSFTIEKIQS